MRHLRDHIATTTPVAHPHGLCTGRARKRPRRKIVANPYFTEADAALTRKIGIVNAHDDFPVVVAKQRFDGVDDSLRTYWIPQFRAGG